MKLQVLSIADRGVSNKERLHLSVLKETGLAYYVVLLSRHANLSSVSSGNLTAYWFPNQQVRPGDQVVLYSGPGNSTNRKEPNGTTTYFYYWGLPESIWRDPVNCAVVLEVVDWATTLQNG